MLRLFRSFSLSTALLSLGASFPVQAQTAPGDTARFYRHHLGLTASPQLDQFFTANRSLPVGLLYKYQARPHALWRVGLVLNQEYNRRDEYDPALPYINRKNNEEFVNTRWGLGLGLGREYTRRFSRHWTGSFGADVTAGFSHVGRVTKRQRVGNGSLNPLVLEDEQVLRLRTYRAAVSPFVGVRYAVWPGVYVSAESALTAAYAQEVFEFYGKTTVLQTGEIIFGTQDFDGQTQTDQFVTLRYQLINQLTLHYTLGRQ